MTSPNSDEQAREKKLAELREAERKGRIISLWTRSGVDERHRRRRSEELQRHEQWKAAYDKALKACDNGGAVVLLGQRGNGKTQAAVEVIRSYCRRELTCYYLRCREVGIHLREAYRPESQLTELAAIKQFTAPHLLVIDECQERPDKDHETRSLTLILDKRYGAERPTILIANCTQKQFADLMGPSVADRICETGGVIQFDWPSFRLGEH